MAADLTLVPFRALVAASANSQRRFYTAQMQGICYELAIVSTALESRYGSAALKAARMVATEEGDTVPAGAEVRAPSAISSRFLRLPVELWLVVVDGLDVDSLLNLKRTSRYFWRLVESRETQVQSFVRVSRARMAADSDRYALVMEMARRELIVVLRCLTMENR